MATKPGEGESMTTGEAAAYARGRSDGLRDAADAIQCSGCGSVAAVLALQDGAAAGDAQEADDGWDDEAGKRINSLITKLEAARAENAALRADLALCRERDGMTGLEYRGG